MSNATPTLTALMPPSTLGRDSSLSTSQTGGTDPSSSLATQSPASRAWVARTLSSPRSSSSTVTIGSRYARDATSTRSSLTSTTPTSPPSVSTSTHSPSSLSSTNPAAHATCPALITRPSSSQSPTTRLAQSRPHPSTSMPPTTTCSASCLAWAVLPTPTKREVSQWLLLVFCCSL